MAEPRDRPTARPAWIWPLTLVLLAALFVGAFVYVFHTLSRLPGAAAERGREALVGLQRVAEAFHTGTVTTAFISYATEVAGVSRLQVAEVRQMELFERTDAATAFWGALELPDLVVRARAPVEYTYYLDLTARWEFEEQNGRIRVLAPPIGFNKPAVDASAIDYEVKAGSLLRNETEALARLKRGITEMSLARARDNVPLIRELARRQTEDFVAGWLAARFVDGEDYSVEVAFQDETGRAPLSPAPRD